MASRAFAEVRICLSELGNNILRLIGMNSSIAQHSSSLEISLIPNHDVSRINVTHQLCLSLLLCDFFFGVNLLRNKVGETRQLHQLTI